MIVKKKLRDVTPEEFNDWRNKNCNNCFDCVFKTVNCSLKKEYSWTSNKKIFSNEFLNQEIEVEVPDILTKEEKEYLKAVIKPFKNRVKYITKIKLDYITEYIKIGLSDVLHSNLIETIFLPRFNKDTMYKNMELEKEYTLEELGLD